MSLQECRATVVPTTTLEIPQYQVVHVSVVRATTTLTLTCQAVVTQQRGNVLSASTTRRDSSVRGVRPVTTETREDKTVDVSNYIAVCNVLSYEISTFTIPCWLENQGVGEELATHSCMLRRRH